MSVAEPAVRAAHLGPELRRPLVLDAALAVWQAHGYRGTTMALIAKEAGVSKPVLYACYDDKDQVLKALLDREEERLSSAAQDALPLALDLDDIDGVMQAAYEAFFTAALSNPASWRVVFEAQRINDEIADRIVRARAMFVEQLHALVAHYFAGQQAEFPAREARLFAENLIALAENNAAMLLNQGSDGTWTAAELAASMTRFVLQGWRPAGPSVSEA
jgi:AcrR family transcriptional regulator